MRWKGRKKSSNVEDRRRSGGGKKAAGGFGLGTIIIIVIAILLGENPLTLLQQIEPAATVQPTPDNYQPSAAEDELAEFVSVVLKETEVVWNKLFTEVIGQAYVEPTLVLFTSRVESACGNATAATGPFYCPGDQKLYIDLSFYQDLKNKFNAPGDFAMAYVVAHEVAHHVQFLLGFTDYVHSKRNIISKKEYNKLSVKLELQADFLAGVWAHHTDRMQGIIEEGDIDEALRAANAIGDDRLQKQSRGYVVPDSFTHGTSEQRKRWFRKGYVTGDINQGNTFTAQSL